MSVHAILKMGDPRLLRQAELVTDFTDPALHTLIADMFDTMQFNNGVGLAAPQIGVNLQIVIFGFKHNSRYPHAEQVPETVLINPVLTPLNRKHEVLDIEDGWEGCLSLPGFRGLVPRSTKLHYEGFDQYRNIINREVEGFHARVVQHECDHLVGVLYPMRMKDLSHFGFADELFPQLNVSND